MAGAPSLITLCIGALRNAILDENGDLASIYLLPSELFDQILPNLPPIALQFLQDAMPSVSSQYPAFSDGRISPSRKRKRSENFDSAWKTLYLTRWSNVKQNEQITDWQQIYWERHLQDCLDAATEMLTFTKIGGSLSEIQIPDSILKSITHEEQLKISKSYCTLGYQFARFGLHARSLRLGSVHLVRKIDDLLSKCRLEYMEIQWIKSMNNVVGLCKLFEQNKESLTSLELVHCKLTASHITSIFDHLRVKLNVTNKIKKVSINHTTFLDSLAIPLPHALGTFLSSARGLTKLVLSDNRLSWKTAKMVFDILLDTESSIQILDLSENNISGWLSHIIRRSGLVSGVIPHKTAKSLKSLCMLNLRCNNLQKDDADCLRYAMAWMPNLKVLNLSENPLKSQGIRSLFPYLIEKSKSKTPLAELHLEECGLDCHGATSLLNILTSSRYPLKSLYIGNNNLTSKFGASLGKFLCSGIESIDVKGIGLGSLGCSDAAKEITETPLSIVRINISGNCGLSGAADFLSKLILNAPKLLLLDASSNWMQMESVPVICSSLKSANGKLELLDLSNNSLCNKPDLASVFAEFQINGKPKIIHPPPKVDVIIVYDDDP